MPDIALGESAVKASWTPTTPELQPDQARPLLRRLTEPTPNAQARLYAPDGRLIADSRVREGAGGAVVTEAAAPRRRCRSPVMETASAARWYDRLMSRAAAQVAGAVRGDQPGSRRGLAARREGGAAHEPSSTGTGWRQMPPYIRRTADDRLLVTVAEPPVLRNRHTVGIVLLTREAREVDESLLAVRMSILGLFGVGAGADGRAVLVPCR